TGATLDRRRDHLITQDQATSDSTPTFGATCDGSCPPTVRPGRTRTAAGARDITAPSWIRPPKADRQPGRAANPWPIRKPTEPAVLCRTADRTSELDGAHNRRYVHDCTEIGTKPGRVVITLRIG